MNATIVHTTDLVHDERASFEHSAALALVSRSRLISLHANAPQSAAARMPEVEELFGAWNVAAPGFDFTKQVHTCCDDPVDTILDALAELQPSLVVLATHKKSALARVFAGSTAEAVAHNATAPVLILPVDPRGFVDEATGAIGLQRVLIPIGDAQAAAAAVQAAADFAALAHADVVQFQLMHVGNPVSVDTSVLSSREGWSVHKLDGHDDIETAIVEQADRACLTVMATRGHDSVGDVLRGSHTDRVLHRTRCPLLAIRV